MRNLIAGNGGRPSERDSHVTPPSVVFHTRFGRWPLNVTYAVFGSRESIATLMRYRGESRTLLVTSVHVRPPSVERRMDGLRVLRPLIATIKVALSLGATAIARTSPLGGHVEPSLVLVGSGSHVSAPLTVRHTLQLPKYSVVGF